MRVEVGLELLGLPARRLDVRLAVRQQQQGLRTLGAIAVRRAQRIETSPVRKERREHRVNLETHIQTRV